jgi:hypothetical protein
VFAPGFLPLGILRPTRRVESQLPSIHCSRGTGTTASGSRP